MVDRSSRQIRQMFGSIAPRYDLLNHLLSLSADRYWRRSARQQTLDRLTVSGPVLDLCTGTGDLALQFAGDARVFACDFSHPMLLEAAEKLERKELKNRISLVEGDALGLPFPDATFAALSIAFGLRNLEDYKAGLVEMRRVLRPGGVLTVLEFSQPSLPIFRQLYQLYFTRVLPWIGRLVSGRSGPYSYLPCSVGEFHSPAGLDDLLRDTGFIEVSRSGLTCGIVTLHTALNPPSASQG